MVIKDWLSYEVESDMFTAADGFTLRVAPTKEYLDFFQDAGHNVRIYYADNLIMTGIIEATPFNVGMHGPQIELTGRDLAALLIDDSMAPMDLENQTLKAILDKIIADHSGDIRGIITDNSANRYGLLGKKVSWNKVRALRKTTATKENTKKLKAEIAKQRAALASRPPLYAQYTTDQSFKRYTELGEKRWAIISRLTKMIGMAAWMSADGYLCVSRPNYEQSPIGRLFVHVDDNGNTTDSNCIMTVSPDCGNRYSDYLCFGQGRANVTSRGKDLSEWQAMARDPSRAFWWDSLQRRRLKTDVTTVKNIGNKKQINRFVRTKMERNAVNGYNCTATVEGHKIWQDGPLWTTDTTVDVDFQPKQIKAPHYIRRRQFVYDTDQGKLTNLTPMPCDIWLAVDHDTLSDSAYYTKMEAKFKEYRL